jgi:hypothetical protein
VLSNSVSLSACAICVNGSCSGSPLDGCYGNLGLQRLLEHDPKGLGLFVQSDLRHVVHCSKLGTGKLWNICEVGKEFKMGCKCDADGQVATFRWRGFGMLRYLHVAPVHAGLPRGRCSGA